VVSVREDIEHAQGEKLKAWRGRRDNEAAREALHRLKSAAQSGANIMEPSIHCARTGVTTGEWADALRQVFGDYRAPTGLKLASGEAGAELPQLIQSVERLSEKLGTPVRLLIGKPGLDGHSNGAEQIALRAGQCGFDVHYQGIRFTPRQIVEEAREARAHLIGLSILSGSHVPLVREVMNGLREQKLDIPVVVGGIIPPGDILILKQLGVVRVYTPKDFEIDRLIAEMIEIIEGRLSETAA
jgi:(2R)-ethylmalonyl-CoA mutase